MPQLAAWAATAFKAAAASAPAAASATAATAAKATLMTSLKTAAMNVLTNVAIATAVSALQPQVGAAGRTFEWTLDPDGPIPFAAGRVGVAGSVVHRKTYGPDLMYYGFVSVLSGAGPIDGFETFRGDDEFVTFDAAGKAISSQWTGEMWLKRSLGSQPDTALVSPAGLKSNVTLPGWSTASKLSGKASYMLALGENSKRTAFPTGEPKPLYVIRGLKGWDPRKDSTYPGGSGACRLNDPSTWIYITNPILWALKWSLGLWEGPTGKGAPQVDYQVGGIGAKLSGIDVPAFVAAANVADANGWTVAAYPTTDDDKSQVLDAFLQAGGCIYAQRAGKISCIQRAAPRTSVVTISAADTAGPLEIDTAASRIDRINTIRPRFWSEAHRWQLTALEEVTAAAYQTEDGAKRTRGIDYPYVTNAVQAAQLAALQIANTREGIAGVIPLKPHLQRIKPGDAFTITEPGFVLNGLKCLCLNTDYDPATGVVRVSFVSETDAKYAFAMGQDPTPPEPPVLTPVDQTFVSPPEAGDWTITPRPPATGGGQLPGFDLSGIVSNSTATAIIVEHGASATGPWKQAYQGPPTVTNIPIDGLQPGASYYVAIQYQRNQNYSTREVYGPYTAPLLDPSPTAPTIVGLQDQITTAFGDIFDVSELVADARADIDAHGVELAAARGGQANLNARIVQVNQARIDGDTANATLITNLTARTANTEADIIDIENAQATETMARVQAISQLQATGSGGSLNQNPTFAAWSGTLPDTYGGISTGNGTISKVAGLNGQPNAMRVASSTTADIAVNQFTQGAKPGGEWMVVEAEWTLVAGNHKGSGVSFLPRTAANGFILERNIDFFAEFGAGTPGQTYRVSKLLDGRHASTAQYGVNLWTRRAAFSPDGAATLDWRKLSIRPANEQEIAAGTALPALQASVTTNSLAIVDLENDAAIASWQVKAVAAGGKPAILEVVSSTAGSYVAIGGEQIFLGANTTIDTVSQTQQGLWGATRRVIANGPPFGPDNLIHWAGPSSIALTAMTKANAGFWQDQTGAYGPTPAPLFWAKATPSVITGTRIGAGTVSTPANSVMVSCYTGIVGATCNWSRVSGDTSISFPSSGFAPTFSATVAVAQTKTAVFVGVVTKGGDVALVYVTVEFQETT